MGSHFMTLVTSKFDESSTIYEANEVLWFMAISSFTNEGQIFDCEIMYEETENAVKSGKATGPGGIVSEHLKYEGPVLLKWLIQIFNAIVSLEDIPTSVK